MGRNVSADGRNRLQTLGHVSAAIGHQVINAFSAIVSSAELVRLHLDAGSERADQAEVLEIVDSIVRNALDASKLTRRLIDFSHQNTDPAEDRDERVRLPVDLNALIMDVIELEGAEGVGEIAWRLRLDPIPNILGDVRQLEIAFRELIRNCRESLPDGSGVISIRTYLDKQGWIGIDIRDSGTGMTREDLGRALEPFYTTKLGHAGVGLAIARGIWRRHQGTISLVGQSPTGTLARLSIEPPRGSIGLDLLRPRGEESPHGRGGEQASAAR
jgi:signal transduction histidine kinase